MSKIIKIIVGFLFAVCMTILISEIIRVKVFGHEQSPQEYMVAASIALNVSVLSLLWIRLRKPSGNTEIVYDKRQRIHRVRITREVINVRLALAALYWILFLTLGNWHALGIFESATGIPAIIFSLSTIYATVDHFIPD